MEHKIASFKDLKNKKVSSSDGNTIGEVHDVVLDLRNGKLAYVLLTSGGFLGMGEKYLPVPFQALQYSAKSGDYTLDVPEERLKKAPNIETKDWPNRPDGKYIDDLYRYYGYKPLQ